MKMMKKCCKENISIPFWVILFSVCFCFFCVHANEGGFDSLVKRDQRKLIVSTEYGQISAVNITTGGGRIETGPYQYHLQFITMEPNALLLPLLLHADILFYVNTGSGRLSYVDYDGDENELQHIDLRRGDVYRLQAGTFFFIQSNLEMERQKLRIYAIFSNLQDDLSGKGYYSGIHELLLGFDNRVLQAAFNVPEDVIEELTSGQPQPLIVHGVQKSKKTLWEMETQFMRSFLGNRNYGMFDFKNKEKKTKVFNILKAKPDVENCNGWSLSVTKKQLKALKHSDMGVFMVNLTKGAMMGPHWNPMATEIGIVLQGRGMIRIVCSGNESENGCKNKRFRVDEGDVFAIPRFHPMAQISFNNESFIFMGFTTASKKNHPQFLAGKRSVLQTLDKLVLAASFKVSNETIDRFLAPQEESIILECTSCAENEEEMMEEEIEREREEARRREEEEARKREEERRREEEARKREEEQRREEEEARKREEEEQRREEEEARKREEKEEEEAKRREEEEEARKREEEEEAAEAARREEERRRREAEQEEEEARRQEEEMAKRQEEEEARRQEEEAARRQEEEEAARREEERRRQEEESARRKEKEAREQEERERQEEEEEEQAARREEKRRRREREQEEEEAREQEEEVARQMEKERQRRQEEEERERRREEKGQQGEGEGEAEAARREEEERQRRAAEEESEATERRGDEEGEHRGGSSEEEEVWRVII